MKSSKVKVAKAFGEALREARTSAKLSQEDLAFESGVDRTFVSMLERGVRQPALESILLLSNALHVPASDLVAETTRRLKTKSTKS